MMLKHKKVLEKPAKGNTPRKEMGACLQDTEAN